VAFDVRTETLRVTRRNRALIATNHRSFEAGLVVAPKETYARSSLRKGQLAMNRFALLSVIALLATACASKGAMPAAAAPPTPTVHPTSSAPRAVELRHFYLLSPGPRATLVVTRSDLAAAERQTEAR